MGSSPCGRCSARRRISPTFLDTDPDDSGFAALRRNETAPFRTQSAAPSAALSRRANAGRSRTPLGCANRKPGPSHVTQLTCLNDGVQSSGVTVVAQSKRNRDCYLLRRPFGRSVEEYHLSRDTQADVVGNIAEVRAVLIYSWTGLAAIATEPLIDDRSLRFHIEGAKGLSGGPY